MHRAGKRSITAPAVAAITLVLLMPANAHAFHAGNMFDKAPGAGGGGGIFYVGAPKRDKGWNCIACHREPEGRIRVILSSDPPGLFETFRYEAGKTYALEAKLEGEHRGLNAGGSNFNGIAVSILKKDNGVPAGEISGYAADVFNGSGPTTIATAGQRPGENRWTFQWTAPPADSPLGVVTIHLGAVDGNGADGAGGANRTLTDPWGDDVYVGSLSIDPPAAPPPTASVIPPRRHEGGSRNVVAWMLGGVFAFGGGWRLRIRRGRAHAQGTSERRERFHDS